MVPTLAVLRVFSIFKISMAFLAGTAMPQELFPEVSSISILPVGGNFCADTIGVKR